MDKVISKRKSETSIGFGAKVKHFEDQKTSDLIKSIEPEDLIKYGLIPEFIGRMPIVATLEELNQDSLVKILKELGFTQAQEDLDPCLFINKETDIIICVHVDDCLISYSDKSKYKVFLKHLREKGFDYTESEKVLRMLGLKIIESNDSITLVQPTFIQLS